MEYNIERMRGGREKVLRMLSQEEHTLDDLEQELGGLLLHLPAEERSAYSRRIGDALEQARQDLRELRELTGRMEIAEHMLMQMEKEVGDITAGIRV